jgi:hypothetical protein
LPALRTCPNCAPEYPSMCRLASVFLSPPRHLDTGTTQDRPRRRGSPQGSTLVFDGRDPTGIDAVGGPGQQTAGHRLSGHGVQPRTNPAADEPARGSAVGSGGSGAAWPERHRFGDRQGSDAIPGPSVLDRAHELDPSTERAYLTAGWPHRAADWIRIKVDHEMQVRGAPIHELKDGRSGAVSPQATTLGLAQNTGFWGI